MTDESEKFSSACVIDSSMTVLDIVSKYNATQDVFKRWDDKAGECICCNALFESLETVAKKYDLDLSSLVQDLKRAAGNDSSSA